MGGKNMMIKKIWGWASIQVAGKDRQKPGPCRFLLSEHALTNGNLYTVF